VLGDHAVRERKKRNFLVSSGTGSGRELKNLNEL
jgi:hypothetical protein